MQSACKTYKLGVIGGGFMANAVISGAISSGFLSPEEIAVSERDEEKRSAFQEYGVHAVWDNRRVAQNCTYLLFAVKPQSFLEIADELHDIRLPVVISIMAGKTKQAIREKFDCAAVARIMPNLPCAVREGISGIDAAELLQADKDFVFGLFGSVGKTLSVAETDLNAVTGISGSGPAYVYLFLKALTEAGISQGLSAEQAHALALQTVKGGVTMAEHSEQSLDDLIAAVSSKGGTTVAALGSFYADDFEGSVKRAVSACVRRAEQLSEDHCSQAKDNGSKKKVTLYTDGACSGNPGAGGWGAILIYGEHTKEFSGGEQNTTNNRMELMAVIMGLKQITRPCEVEVYSDSAYVVNAFHQNWLEGWERSGWKKADNKPVLNVDLWQELLELTRKHTVRFCKVKGHADNELNNRCDELARGAIEQ